MSDKNTSTLQSYVDSASGAVQSALGSLTGSTADKVFPFSLSHLPFHPAKKPNQAEGEQKKDEAAVKNDLSHATAKVGPFSASTSGAVTKDDPNRQEGSWNQTVGSAKETVGGIVGSEVRSFLLLPFKCYK
jgi:uncharacterized protein YjbJ (UPF0337 family)